MKTRLNPSVNHMDQSYNDRGQSQHQRLANPCGLWLVTILIIMIYLPLTGAESTGNESVASHYTNPGDLVNVEINHKIEQVDIYYLYNISFNKLNSATMKSCMVQNKRAIADCVYNSEKKWGPISDNDIKSTCCSFWEADECLTQLVLGSCSLNQSTLYTTDEELNLNKKLLSHGFCSSYQQMSDCDFPFWLVVAIIVSLVILFFICGFAVLNNFMRR